MLQHVYHGENFKYDGRGSCFMFEKHKDAHVAKVAFNSIKRSDIDDTVFWISFIHNYEWYWKDVGRGDLERRQGILKAHLSTHVRTSKRIRFLRSGDAKKRRESLIELANILGIMVAGIRYVVLKGADDRHKNFFREGMAILIKNLRQYFPKVDLTEYRKFLQKIKDPLGLQEFL